MPKIVGALVSVDDALVVVGEADYWLVPEGPLTSVLRLVDGERSDEEIVHRLGDVMSAEEVHYCLIGLESKGVLESGGTEADSQLSRVVPGTPGTPWLDEWARCGYAPLAATAHSFADTRIVLTTDYLDPDLEELNRAAIRLGTPYLLVRPGRTETWIGPYVRPGTSACWACVASRVGPNLPARRMAFVLAAERRGGLERLRETFAPGAEGITRLHRELSGLSAMSIASLAGAIVRLAEDGQRTAHPISRRPSCHDCGVPERRHTSPLRLRTRKRVPGSRSGYRTVPPEDTLAHYGHLVDPITGVVRELNPIPVRGTDLVHTYTASHAMHVEVPSVRTLTHERRDHSGGKGSTDLDARVGALCEALERTSAVFRGDETTVYGTRDELGITAVEPGLFLGFSVEQYASRDLWNATIAGDFQRVPEPFDPEERLCWTPFESLSNGGTRCLPTAFSYFSYEGPGTRFGKADSNGLAAGNCPEEAILQGFLELVERDATALWWYNRTRHAAVDLDQCGDPYVGQVVRYYSDIGRGLWALDLTTDLGIPCFGAISRRDGNPSEEITMGFGAHLDASIALRRAVTELNQALPTALQTRDTRRSQLLPDFRDAADWLDQATVEEQPYLLPDEGQTQRSLIDFEPLVGSDLLEDVETCVAIAAKAGIEVLVLDMTRAEIGLSVMKVVAPGLRHMWRRLGPGRLYDVPVELGRLRAPHTESELNPIPLFL